MRFRLLLCVWLSGILLLTAAPAFAQPDKGLHHSRLFNSYYYRGPLGYTLGFGGTAYTGDLCKGADCLKLGGAWNLGLNYRILPPLVLVLDLQNFRLRAEDYLKARGISFTSRNLELTLLGRYYFIFDEMPEVKDRQKQPRFWKPYGVLGVGYLRYKPKSLPADSTEGKYPQSTFTIPVGAGMDFRLGPGLHLLPEVVYRFSSSDFLDDVSKRGNPNRNDGYLTFMLKLQVTPRLVLSRSNMRGS